MPVELELKLRVDDHAVVRRALTEQGARCISDVVETNHILDRPDGSLRRCGRGLRVRANHVVRGDAPRATLTSKGPRQPSAMKRREEHETAIDDVEQTLAILGALGFVVVLRYRKRRESWLLNGCRVELDCVAGLGTFVEIEGPAQDVILTTRDRLGLSDAVAVQESYVRMLTKRQSCCDSSLDDPT